MRLLRRASNGDLRLTEDLNSGTLPQYAILSHTWGTEEVTFKDMVDGTGKHKSGYAKISFCAEQARKDGLDFFWVDTCCIDKSTSDELQASLNSMFRWYRDSARCYAYLSDVSNSAAGLERIDGNPLPPQLEQEIRGSRWFTRGWTLQELLAPPSVDFFTGGGEFLGNKQDLESLIHGITGIPIPALHTTSLSQFSVDERLAWAATRQTTRPEDLVYCLLGIFGVFMPIIYGEGREYAMQRLRDEIGGSLSRRQGR
jgi:hypothetical protein